MRNAAMILAILALAGCSTGPKALPKPDGQVFRLNPDRWVETVNDIPRQQATR